MRTQPETRARSAQEAGKRALNLGASKANQACNECVGSYLALDPPFNLRSFELYGNWFDNSSSMTLAQAGNYKGVDGIKEGFQFIFPSSPYIATVGRLRSDSSFVSFDAEKRSCVVMNKFHGRIQMSEMVGNELFETAFMITLDWRFDDQKIGDTNVFCAPLSWPWAPMWAPLRG